jgi:hypothetical protein
MTLSRKRLKRIIKEEMQKYLKESPSNDARKFPKIGNLSDEDWEQYTDKVKAAKRGDHPAAQRSGAALKAFLRQQGVTQDEDDDRGFFYKLFFGEEMNEVDVVSIAAVGALGGILGVLALKAAGVAGRIAKNILINLDAHLENKIRSAGRQMRSENQEYVLAAFQQDKELLKMLVNFDKLTKIVKNNKGKRSPQLQKTRAELKRLSPAITARLREIQGSVEAGMPHPAKGGADPLSDKERTRLKPRIKR